jgi:hypothetical protein
VDLLRPEFDRSTNSGLARDPAPELAFEIANQILSRIRAYSRVFEIKPLLIERDPWLLRYLGDDGQELPVEEGKIRGCGSGPSRIGYAVVSPETYKMIVDHPDTNEPYIWDELLLDARDQLPNVGNATVMAFAAMENFIGWTLDG